MEYSFVIAVGLAIVFIFFWHFITDKQMSALLVIQQKHITLIMTAHRRIDELEEKLEKAGNGESDEKNHD